MIDPTKLADAIRGLVTVADGAVGSGARHSPRFRLIAEQIASRHRAALGSQGD